MDELMKGVKIGKLLGKQEKRNELVKVAVITATAIASIAAIVGVGFAIYNKYVKKEDYYDDFEDDFDDLFDEDSDELDEAVDEEEDIFED